MNGILLALLIIVLYLSSHVHYTDIEAKLDTLIEYHNEQ